jgi:hypothetical protein
MEIKGVHYGPLQQIQQVDPSVCLHCHNEGPGEA